MLWKIGKDFCHTRYHWFMTVHENLKMYFKTRARILYLSLSEINVVYKTGPLFILPHFQRYIQRKVKPQDAISLANPDHFSPLLDPGSFRKFNYLCPKANISAACREWIGQGRKQNETYEISARQPYLVHRFLHLGHQGFQSKKQTNSRIDVCDSKLGISRAVWRLSSNMINFAVA